MTGTTISVIQFAKSIRIVGNQCRARHKYTRCVRQEWLHNHTVKGQTCPSPVAWPSSVRFFKYVSNLQANAAYSSLFKSKTWAVLARSWGGILVTTYKLLQFKIGVSFIATMPDFLCAGPHQHCVFVNVFEKYYELHTYVINEHLVVPELYRARWCGMQTVAAAEWCHSNLVPGCYTLRFLEVYRHNAMQFGVRYCNIHGAMRWGYLFCLTPRTRCHLVESHSTR